MQPVNTELENAKTLLNKRNKVIRFADKSPAGWTAVEEYESDELADHSDNEKKLRSAERRALTKLRARKQNRSSAQNRKFSQDSSLVAGSSLHHATPQPFRPQQLPQQPFRPQSFRSRQPQPSDKCFSCGQFGNWATSPFCQNTVACTATEPCQAHPALPPASSETFNRLGTDEYFNVVVDLCSHDQTVGIEERDSLERSYKDYLEGSESVIVKGRLRVNVDFWESIGASQFILSVIKEGYKIPFYYTPTPVILHNNKSALYRILILFSVQLPNFLKLVRSWSVLFRRWLFIPCRFSFNPTGRKGFY